MIATALNRLLFIPMSDMPAAISTAPGPIAATAVQPAKAAQRDLNFHDILSALNPLQYLPVVGTLYRATTGDVIPEPLRVGGSMLVSGLLSGPIGLIVNIAMTIAEKATGIDPEKIVADQLRPSIEGAAPADSPPAAAGSFEIAPRPFSPQQLAAYGIHMSASDAADTNAADKLNMLELSRLHAAAAAYAKQMTLV